MKTVRFRPPLFLLAGLLWLSLSALLGLMQFLGMVTGVSLPPALRLVHVHGALLAGVAQIILGAMLAFIPPLLLTGRDRSDSHPVLFVLINAGGLAVLAGFALRNSTVVGVSGLLAAVAFLSLFINALQQTRNSLVSPPLNLWFYGVAILMLLIGMGLGAAMALHWLPDRLLGQIRLAHIHLNLLGFVTLTIIGTMHNLFPTVLNTALYSPRLARLTFFIVPLGVLLLVAGFLSARLWLQIGAGIVVLIGVGLYGWNIVRTWIQAQRPLRIASDHFLLATFFLVLTVPVGMLVAVNSFHDPPLVPFGTLHLVAYTHLALVGFVMQTILGALSHLLPIILALRRVSSNKKRGPYLARLTAVVERWRAVQVGTVSLGTAGLALVAALVWQYSLSSWPVQIATWFTAGLLFLGLAMFAGKISLLLLLRPPE